MNVKSQVAPSEVEYLIGFDNDLNEKLDRVMQRAVADENALVYAFGERWGPEAGLKDKYFGFCPATARS